MRLVVTLACLLAAANAGMRPSPPYRLEYALNRQLASSSSVGLTNHLGTQYMVDLAIDGKTYSVQIDTGSADLWVGCEYVSTSACVNPCPADGITITYGSGSACVVPHKGSISLGNTAFSDGVFGIGMTSSVLGNVSQGILGLAFPGLSSYGSFATNASYTVFHLDSFSMFLTPKSDQSGSKLVINGVDDALVKSRNLVGVRIPLATGEKDYWNINITQFGVDAPTWNQKPCKNGDCMAIVDSGTSFLSMPKSVFQAFVTTYLLQDCAYKTSYYVCPKTLALPRISFQFGDNSTVFYLNSWDYSLVYSETEIIIQVQVTPAGRLGDRWIIGDTFLKVYYTTYDVKAKAVVFYCPDGQCNGGENVLDFSSSMPTWALVLFIAGGSLVGLSVIGLIVYYVRRRRATRQAKQPHSSVWVVDGDSPEASQTYTAAR
ncbi:gastricsin [Achlya hypogyna]|uniref:Gastricsin n=1 Tax=Achlya hypogyna TaxID=1202772 RepID=A0A1V9YWZ5_ACHHY|nr:gastricsin [Achlya hypogyna]